MPRPHSLSRRSHLNNGSGVYYASDYRGPRLTNAGVRRRISSAKRLVLWEAWKRGEPPVLRRISLEAMRRFCFGETLEVNDANGLRVGGGQRLPRLWHPHRAVEDRLLTALMNRIWDNLRRAYADGVQGEQRARLQRVQEQSSNAS